MYLADLRRREQERAVTTFRIRLNTSHSDETVHLLEPRAAYLFNFLSIVRNRVGELAIDHLCSTRQIHVHLYFLIVA